METIVMQILDIACIATAVALTTATAVNAQTGSSANQTAASGILSLTFTGIDAKQGNIMLALFDEAGWEGGKPIRAGMVGAASEAPSVSISGLPAGRYGVKAFHDVNGNGKMDTNPFGMPTEPYAFSNNAHGQAGPAQWSDASFDVQTGPNQQTITIR